MSGTAMCVAAVGALLCAAFLAVVLRAQRPELALGLSLTAGILVLGLVLGELAPLAATLRRMTAWGGLADSSFSVVLRAAGVCLVTQLTADTCRDAGESALAGKAELAGRFVLLLMSLPLFEQILTLIIGVADGQAVTG